MMPAGFSILDLMPPQLRGAFGADGSMQQTPAAAQPRLPIYQDDNPLNAAIQNFTHSRSLLGGLADAYTGATTGYRTDPLGSQMQMLNFTYQALRRAGVPDAQAQLGATNETVQKAIVAKMFPTYAPQNIGNTTGSFNPATGEFRPQYVAPSFQTASPDQQVFSYQPGIPGQPSPQYPRTQPGPIQATPLPPPPGARGPMPVAGAGALSSGTNFGGNTQMLSPGMSVAEKARQEAAGGTAGRVQAGAAAVLPNTLANFDHTANLIEDLKADETGMNWATGSLFGRLPVPIPFTGASDYMAKLNQLESLYGDLKTKGGLTEIQAKKGEDAVAALTRAQSTPQFKKALTDLGDVVAQGRANAITIAGGDPNDPKFAPSQRARPGGPQANAPTAAGAGQAPTIINRKTGQRMILRNGQWAPMQ
jgi:hypothetical protein